MSTSSLPSYVAPSFSRTPSYSVEPHQSERRIASAGRLRPRPTGDFVKKSRNGDIRLRLTAQENNTDLPSYGVQGRIEGVVELAKAGHVNTVEVKIEGRLLLREIAEGGTTYAKLCLATDVLWKKDTANTICPKSLSFSLYLPTTLDYEAKTCPLPPTFDVKLSGLPGFTATIDYSVTAIVTKPQQFPTPSRLPLKSTVLGGSVTVSMPFNYYPRSRPATPLPSPLTASRRGFNDALNWTCHQSEIRPKGKNIEPIKTKLYIPASRTFCISQSIPFHLMFESSAYSLAAFLPYCPTASFIKRKQATRIQLMRQSTVDVRNSVVSGTKTDIWRIDCIGEGSFRHTADGPSWTAFSGEINISETVKVTGFKVAGLSVKDCILFAMMPPDQQRSPFAELRQLVPVKLTTDAWVADGTGVGATLQHAGSEYSLSSVLDHTEETVHG